MSARIFAIIELSHFVNTRHTIYSIKKNQTTRRKNMTSKKIKMTFDKYDKLEEKCMNAQYELDGWYPTIEDIQKFVEPSPDKFISFLIFLANQDVKEEQIEAKKYINNFLRHTLELI